MPWALDRAMPYELVRSICANVSAACVAVMENRRIPDRNMLVLERKKRDTIVR